MHKAMLQQQRQQQQQPLYIAYNCGFHLFKGNSLEVVYQGGSPLSRNIVSVHSDLHLTYTIRIEEIDTK